MLNAMIHSEAVIKKWIYYLKKMYQQYKLAPITHKLWSKQHMLHIWSTAWMERTFPHFTTYNFPFFFKKNDWSRMPTGEKHIMKYLVCIFPTIRGKFLFLLCLKIYQKTIFLAPKSMIKQLSIALTIPLFLHCLQLTAEMRKCFALVLLFKFMSMKS
jgi:hypothetical protein